MGLGTDAGPSSNHCSTRFYEGATLSRLDPDQVLAPLHSAGPDASDVALARSFAAISATLDRLLCAAETILTRISEACSGSPSEWLSSETRQLRVGLAARFRMATSSAHAKQLTGGIGHPILSPWELAALAYFRVHLRLFHELSERGAGLPRRRSDTTGYRRNSSRLSLMDPGEDEALNAGAASQSLDDSDVDMPQAQTLGHEKPLRDPFAAADAINAMPGLLEGPRGPLASGFERSPAPVVDTARTTRSRRDFLAGLSDRPEADLMVHVETSLLLEGLKAFRATCDVLSRLCLLRDLEPIYSDLVLEQVHKHIAAECAGLHNERGLLERMVTWAKEVVAPWIGEIVGARSLSDGSGGASARREYAQWKNRLIFHTTREFAELRISEIFDIIVDFPDSLAAVNDLRRAMAHVEAAPLLIQSLRNELRRRLLHQGAQTKDILQWYINAIKAMRILDPRGLILARCSAGVRKYLRSREDTVRCIITAILDDVEGETFATTDGEAPELNMDDDEEGPDDVVTDWADPLWTPLPTEADPANLAESQHSADIMATLVSIYDTKEVFIREFQTLLADRLLSVRGYDTNREVHNLELLKKRFGEGSLGPCEVMIKDLADSKRLDGIVHRSAVLQNAVPLHAQVLSRLFWPTFRDDYESEPLKVPHEVVAAMDAYSKGFSSFKAGRSLVWMPRLGSVDLELEMDDGRVLEFSNLNPLQATIIDLFQRQARWSLADLSETTEADDDTIRREIGFWIGHGLLREKRSEPGTWILVQDTDSGHATPRDSLGSKAGMSPILAGGRRKVSSEFERRMRRLSDESKILRSGGSLLGVEEMRRYETFIFGMLRNLGSMSSEQIHTRLAPFIQPARPLADIKRLLEVMVVEDKLDHQGTVFSIKRS